MKLLLRNLCEEVCENELQTLFGTYGTVRVTKVLRDEQNRSRGIAIVEMEDGAEAAVAALNHANYKAQYLVISQLDGEQASAGFANGVQH
jgi:RNA recognition motif-containing protein